MSEINGIDVSECSYFINHTPPKGQGDWCGAIHKGACKVYSKDCEYNKDCYYKQLKRMQKENEELKKLKKYYKGFVANCRYCDEWYMDKCNYIKKDNKYKQALEEIRNEIGDLKNINRLINLQKILDIINEVSNDDLK